MKIENLGYRNFGDVLKEVIEKYKIDPDELNLDDGTIFKISSGIGSQIYLSVDDDQYTTFVTIANGKAKVDSADRYVPEAIDMVLSRINDMVKDNQL